MQENSYNIQPAQRLQSVSEYYFSRKGKEVARLNAEGKDIISLAIGSPDMPPSPETIETLCTEARKPNAHGCLGAIAGDAVYDEVEPIVAAITPVPGGVGTVTTSVLVSHVVEAAEKSV